MNTKGIAYAKHLVPTLSWHPSLKTGGVLAQVLLPVVGLVAGRINRSWAIVLYRFGWYVWTLRRHQGTRGLAIHLKALSVLTSQKLAGIPHKTTQCLGPSIARSHSGWPRVIPSLHRIALDRRSAVHARVWLTLFGLYRVLDWSAQFKIGTIVDGPSFTNEIYQQWLLFLPKFVLLLSPYRRKVSAPNLEAKVVLLLKTGPNSRDTSTSLSNFLVDALTWVNHPLWGTLVSYCSLTGNDKWLSFISNCARVATRVGVVPGEIGKLGVKEEPGKLRVFAMVDCFTQCLLRPLHLWLFDLLRTIPQDGTFDQERPLKRLLDRYPNEIMWSLDLSAATDRLPVALQSPLLEVVVGLKGIGALWERLLVGREYFYNFDNDNQSHYRRGGLPIVGKIRYGTGQPMGAYSSWAMLALVHHAIVQFAAYQTGYQGWFDAYAVLGDDVVIANSIVARRYLAIMRALGVNVGLAKSLKGRGSCEFARRLVIRGVWVTPASLREFALVRSFVPALLELVRRLSNLTVPRISAIARAAGFGYKAVSRLSRPIYTLRGRLQGLMVALKTPGPGPYSSVSWVEFLGLAGRPQAIETRYPAVWQHIETRVRDLLLAADKKSDSLSDLKMEIHSRGVAIPDVDPWMGSPELTHGFPYELTFWSVHWIAPLVAAALARLDDAVLSVRQLGPSLGHVPDSLSALETLLKAMETADDALSLVGDVGDFKQMGGPPRSKHQFSRILHLFRRVGRILRN